MLKPAKSTLEGQSAVGVIVGGAVAIVSVLWPDSQLASIDPDTLIAGAKSAAELADGLKYELATKITKIFADHGLVGGILFFVYKVWRKMAEDRKELKIEELKALSGGAKDGN